jgi:hypothetical protein
MPMALRPLMVIILVSAPPTFSLNANAINSGRARRGEYSTQTAAPQETPGPDFFREKFDNPSTLWPQNEKAYVEKGKLNVKGDCAAPVGAYVYEDFEATVIATLFTGVQREEKGPTRSTADIASLPVIGLSFRVNRDGYYTVLLSPLGGSGEGIYKLFKVVGDKQIELTSWRRDAAIKMRNEITVRSEGPRIDLYINAIRVADFKDESHKSGRITLVFSGGLGSFDDLVIKRLKK